MNSIDHFQIVSLYYVYLIYDVREIIKGLVRGWFKCRRLLQHYHFCANPTSFIENNRLPNYVLFV